MPPPTDWRTTDADELAKRKLRAREERHRITNLDPAHPVFSNFEVRSPSGMTYCAEIRDIASRQFSCACRDFRINGLGTCKHIESILLQLARRHEAEFKSAERISSSRFDIVDKCIVTVYDCSMIRSWRHKGLRKFFETGSRAGIQPHHADRLRRELQALNQATKAEQLDVPGWRLHQLTTGEWSLWVNGNWRITFLFENGDAVLVDYRDYH